ncbi:MAG: MBL fold metallo-hydrolase [Acidimicrobiia bacterium]
MFFRQYYLGCLSQASYLIGDETTGRAVVIDPLRDVAQYLDDAAANGLTIERVIETHFHADFLSGHLELAAATGAVISYGDAAAGRAEFDVDYLANGAVVSLGTVELEIRATPGHTPESLCVVIHDQGRNHAPFGVCTGDTLFIGDVGRPDLLASVGVTADELARQLYRSLHTQLLTLPDDTRVFPAHGAGSACGKHLSSETESTIGVQRHTNYALAPMTEDEFVAAVTSGQPAAPLYFAFAAQRNTAQRDTLDEHADVTELTLDDALDRKAAGAVIVDTRSVTSFAHSHLVDAINVELDGRFAEYVGEVVPPKTPMILVTEPARAQEARNRLARIGFDDVIGALADVERAFATHPDLLAQASRLTADAFDALRAADPNIVVIDVRGPGEFEFGAIPGALHIPLPELLARLDELDASAPTVVYCQSGVRSSIAASVMRAHGFTDVSDIIGGYASWASREAAAR